MRRLLTMLALCAILAPHGVTQAPTAEVSTEATTPGGWNVTFYHGEGHSTTYDNVSGFHEWGGGFVEFYTDQGGYVWKMPGMGENGYMIYTLTPAADVIAPDNRIEVN